MSLYKPTVANFSAKVLTLDYVLRWISVGVFRFGIQNNEAGSKMMYFILFQLLIAIFTISYALLRDFSFRAMIEKKNFPPDDWNGKIDYYFKGFTIEKPYDVIGTTMSVIVRIFYLLTFCYMVVSVSVDLTSIDFNVQSTERTKLSLVFTGTLFIYGLFVMFISVLSVPDVPHKTFGEEAEDLKDTPRYADVKAGEKDYHENVDKNDIAIVALEGQVKNLNSRVDAYVLESVMFGALTFSGFLTLIAIDPGAFQISYIREFGTQFSRFAHDLMVFELDKIDNYEIFKINETVIDSKMRHINRPMIDSLSTIREGLVKLKTLRAEDSLKLQHLDIHISNLSSPTKSEVVTNNLLSWIMLQTLICSSFFLLVIAARLQFTQLIEKIDNAMRLARTYNDKEEEVFILYLQDDSNSILRKRLEKLGEKIEKQLTISRDLLSEVVPVIQTMGFFRNIGVFIFLIIIITSLIFFDNNTAIFFTVLSLLIYLYKQIDDWYRKIKLEAIILRHSESTEKELGK